MAEIQVQVNTTVLTKQLRALTDYIETLAAATNKLEVALEEIERGGADGSDSHLQRGTR